MHITVTMEATTNPHIGLQRWLPKFPFLFFSWQSKDPSRDIQGYKNTSTNHQSLPHQPTRKRPAFERPSPCVRLPSTFGSAQSAGRPTNRLTGQTAGNAATSAPRTINHAPTSHRISFGTMSTFVTIVRLCMEFWKRSKVRKGKRSHRQPKIRSKLSKRWHICWWISRVGWTKLAIEKRLWGPSSQVMFTG